MKKLLIMRHGEAEMFAASDAERKLTDSGFEQSQRAGQCMIEYGFNPDIVLLSPYLRTQQTSQAVLSNFGDISSQQHDFLTPDNSPALVAEQLFQQESANLLVVSHQPLVSLLIALLLNGDNSESMPPSMSPASIALLSADDLLPGCCQLEWICHAPNYKVSH
ncbi:MAG: phosphohistidine phosphatase [Oceanicoccus sp.]|jgi:phosphohistidine phosphatase